MGSKELNRRQLLAAGIAASAGLSSAAAQAQNQEFVRPQRGVAVGTSEPEPLPRDRRVGIAIVGIGAYATEQIIPSFAETNRCRLAGFVTGDVVKGAQFANRYDVPAKNVFAYDEMDKLASAPDIDAVYIITPNALHRKHTEVAAKAGKHVLCEKPMATNVQDAEAMIKACADAKKLLMIGYRCHYEPYNQRAIEMCRSGKLGKIVSLTSEHGRTLNPAEKRDQWRMKKALSGGGSLPDIGIYSLNAMRYLTGEEPEEIFAYMHSPKDDPRFAEVEATVHFTLKFPSGALAHCISSYDWSEVKRGQVYGTQASMELDPLSDYYRHNMTISQKEDGSDTPIAKQVLLPEQNQFARQLDHFAECVRTGRTPRTPGEEGLRDVRYIEAIYESARTSKPVKLK